MPLLIVLMPVFVYLQCCALQQLKRMHTRKTFASKIASDVLVQYPIRFMHFIHLGLWIVAAITFLDYGFDPGPIATYVSLTVISISIMVYRAVHDCRLGIRNQHTKWKCPDHCHAPAGVGYQCQNQILLTGFELGVVDIEVNPVAHRPVQLKGVTGHDAADVPKQSDARTYLAESRPTSKPNLSDADATTDTNTDQRSSRNSLWFSSVKPSRTCTARQPAARVVRKEDKILSLRSDKTTSQFQLPVTDRAKRIDIGMGDDANLDQKMLTTQHPNKAQQSDAISTMFASINRARVSKLSPQKRGNGSIEAFSTQPGNSKRNSQKLSQLKDRSKKKDKDWKVLNQRHAQERADLKLEDHNHHVVNL